MAILIENYRILPKNDADFIASAINDWDQAVEINSGDPYEASRNFDAALASIGYACEWGLDGVPFLIWNIACQKAIGLAATHLHLGTMDESDYWGSEEDINLGNAVYEQTISAVGFDPNDDAMWAASCNKATSTEIDVVNINELLHRFYGISKNNDQPIYISVVEELYRANEWRRIADSESVNPIDTKQIQVWSSDNLTEDYGWSSKESAELNALSVGHGVFAYSDHGHSIVRVR